MTDLKNRDALLQNSYAMLKDTNEALGLKLLEVERQRDALAEVLRKTRHQLIIEVDASPIRREMAIETIDAAREALAGLDKVKP